MPDYISREAAMPDGFCVGVSCQECPFCDDPIKGGCKAARFIDAIPAADVVERPRWIPVTERLPEERKYVLCKCRADIIDVLRFENAEWYHDPTHVYMYGFVTHWMPLPEPPREEKHELIDIRT